jgi:hypothetical protein
LLKLDGSPKNESLDTTTLNIIGSHDVQPQPLDVGVHEESEYEGAPGAEVLDSNDDIDEDNDIPV